VKDGFSIHVAKESCKFSSAHFIAYPGFREPLHGHNYQIGVRVEGRLGDTGYVLDFGLIKRLTKEIADRLDERTIIPALSDCLKIDQTGGQLLVQYENDHFAFPLADVALLPISHSSAEELAQFVWDELRAALEVHNALAGIVSLQISVAESPGQAAILRQAIEKVID
jgi:dihydroneopterin triphosphate aldolase (PTPS-III) / 6-pyruvoyltetrahydropterin synthase